MLHTTHCEILGDLLPQNVTIQYTQQARMALSFVLRTFEEKPEALVPSLHAEVISDQNTGVAETNSSLQVTMLKASGDVDCFCPRPASTPSKVSFKALDDSELDDCISASDDTAGCSARAAALPLDTPTRGSGLYLVQNHRCLMLNLSAEQIREYMSLMQSHPHHLFYASGRLLPAHYVLAPNSRNQLSGDALTTNGRNPLHGLSLQHKKLQRQQYQRKESLSCSGEQSSEMVLVVDTLFVIDPELQKDPQRLQETIERHLGATAAAAVVAATAAVPQRTTTVAAAAAPRSTSASTAATPQAAASPVAAASSASAPAAASAAAAAASSAQLAKRLGKASLSALTDSEFARKRLLKVKAALSLAKQHRGLDHGQTALSYS